MNIRKIKKELQRALNKKDLFTENWVIFKNCSYAPKTINTLFDKYKLCLQDCSFKFKDKLFRAEAYTKIENGKILYIGVEECKTKHYKCNYYIFVFYE